jgi:PhoPQ-activated pathogenicity-related protein
MLPLIFPMTKSAKRGLDAVEQFLNAQNIPNPGTFVASGTSKRGWTSLLTTAVDPRVVSNVPIIFDLINQIPVFYLKFVFELVRVV